MIVNLDFINQLKALGYVVQELKENFISIKYKIPVGRFINNEVEIAFQIPSAFPLTPPSGPHFKPQLLPITGGGGVHPTGAIHNSPLGPEWEYWSRPFNNWGKTNKTVKSYLEHIKHLLDFD